MSTQGGPVKTWRALRSLRLGNSEPFYGDLCPEIGQFPVVTQRNLEQMQHVEVIYTTQAEIDKDVADRKKRETPEKSVTKATKKRVVRRVVKKRVLAEQSV